MTSGDAEGQRGSADVSLRERLLDGELTIYDPRSEQAAFLNQTATAIWGLADGTRDDEQIAMGIAQQFAQDPAVVAVHIAAVLDELDSLGLLEQRDPPRRRP